MLMAALLMTSSHSEGLDEAMIADNLMRKRNEVGIVLMQNEVAHEAIVRVAELGHLAEKLVIFKASPIRNATDISDLLYGWVDILVVNEWEAPILLGWPSTKKAMFPLKTLRHSQIAAKELQNKHSVGVVVVVTPAGYVVRSRGGKCEDWLDAMPNGECCRIWYQWWESQPALYAGHCATPIIVATATGKQ